MTALVLCKSIREAQAFGQEIGERVTYASNANAVSGFRPSMIVELPSFYKRPDRHAIQFAVRRLQRRHRNEIPVRVYDEWTPRPKPVVHEDEIEGQISFDEIEWKNVPAGDVVVNWRNPEPKAIDALNEAMRQMNDLGGLPADMESHAEEIAAETDEWAAEVETYPPPKPAPKKRTPRAERVTKLKSETPAPPPGPVDDEGQVDAGFPRMPEFRWDD